MCLSSLETLGQLLHLRALGFLIWAMALITVPTHCVVVRAILNTLYVYMCVHVLKQCFNNLLIFLLLPGLGDLPACLVLLQSLVLYVALGFNTIFGVPTVPLTS